jgi:hypothetical protein
MFRKLALLHPSIRAPPAAMSWGPRSQVRYTAHPQQMVPIADCHDRILPREGHRVGWVYQLVNFHASVEGPQDHEVLHHAVVLELVL